jgi:hypothetical protein
MAHEHPDHVVALLDEQMGRDAGIDSATHRQHNTRHRGIVAALVATPPRPYNSHMEKEFVDRAKAIREGILQLRDSL